MSLRQSFLSLTAVAAVASVGLVGNSLIGNTPVAIGTGTVDVRVNGGDGPAQEWSGGSLVLATDKPWAPGDERSMTFEVENVGQDPVTVDLHISSSTDNIDSCLSWNLRGGTATDTFAASMVARGDVSQAVALPAAGGSSWLPSTTRSFTLTLAMRASCHTQPDARRATFDVSVVAVAA